MAVTFMFAPDLEKVLTGDLAQTTTARVVMQVVVPLRKAHAQGHALPPVSARGCSMQR